MECIFRLGLVTAGLFLVIPYVISQTEQNEPANALISVCMSDERPYSDFDFVLGSWDFYAPDGNKIGEQVYTKREQGCLITEEMKFTTGHTGFGMSFVDPETGLWRQIWMSPMYYVDYSGGLDESGAMVLEGTAYPNNGGKSTPIRGVWSKQVDGSIKQEFLLFSEKTKTWDILFAGFTRPKID